MPLKDHSAANSPDTMKAMVGETIAGVIADDKGQWWLIVESGHALVLGKTGAYWPESPKAVKELIAKRQHQLKSSADEIARLTAIDRILP